MRKIFLLMNISLDGYFEDANQQISGFKNDNEAFSEGESAEVDTLLFGRKTYEGMTFWSTPEAREMMPEVAKFMNETPKVVVSHHDFDPGWENVTVVSQNAVAAIRTLKAQVGKTIAIFGSNNLCVSLMQHRLIDEFQIIVNPVVFGAGSSLFAGLTSQAELTLKRSKPFKSGAVMLTYHHAENATGTV